MVGFGTETTEAVADLNFANVKLLSIDKCIHQMYGEKNPNTENYDKKNAICMHGKGYYF